MISALLSGAVAGLAVAVPVGAVGALVVMTGARSGWRIAAAGGAGVATVDALYAVLAVIGGSTVAAIAVGIAMPLRVTAGVVLLLLGALMIRSGVRARDAGSTADADRSRLFGSAWHTYVSLVGITAVNPATVIYFATLVVGGHLGDGAAETGVMFVAGVFAGSVSWQVLLASGGAALGGALTGPRGRRWTAFVGGGITALLALRTLLGWPS